MTAVRAERPIHIRFWIGLLCFFLLSTTICLLVWAVAPTFFGWRPVAVTSGSMNPFITPGDIIVAQPQRGDGLGVGTVIVFQDPAGDGLVTHRIEAVTPTGEYTTRGDSNGMADSTPVAPQRVVGVGRLLVPMVGAPLVWAWEGRWVLVVAVAVAILATGWCSRWALLVQFDPWRQGPAQNRPLRRPRRVAVPAGLKIFLPFLAMTLILASAPARSAMTGSTGNGGNILSAANFATVLLHLHNFPTPPTGNTVSQAVLPLTAPPPVASTLYNYDANRNSNPGLTIAKGSGLSETDPTKHQIWSAQGPFDLQGPATLTLWGAMKDFDSSKRGIVQVAVLDCASNGSNCSTIATGTLDNNPWSPGSGSWAQKAVSLGSINHSLAANRTLRIKVVVGSSSDDDMWFAYDTVTYPSQLHVGP